MLESGAQQLAPELGAEWVYWETGTRDILRIQSRLLPTALLMLAGMVIILIIAVGAFIMWARRVRP
ncbi:MAG: hypothetical protein EA427_14420 [Spirochaetaceae bacterium]|nr:MAG: hypothetical protein EA427_14420 [Spirochaetaceae bacterium]